MMWVSQYTTKTDSVGLWIPDVDLNRVRSLSSEHKTLTPVFRVRSVDAEVDTVRLATGWVRFRALAVDVLLQVKFE